MTEQDAVERVSEPGTLDSLVADFREVGLEAGDTVLVHASLSSLGWVAGGAPTVVDALQRVLTDMGTLVMPTHSPHFSDPADWQHPPVPDDWKPVIRAETPAYRPAITPTRGMGAIAECFRNYPDAVRSGHPLHSFAAWGADADDIVANHSLDHSLGEESPLARLYDRDAQVLLLGTDHATNTSLHLAEYRADIDIAVEADGAPILVAGRREWVEFEDLAIDDDDFADLGAAFDAEVGVTEGTVGAATAKLLDQRALVDFGVEWLEANR